MAPSLTRREALGGAAAALVLASCGGGDPPPPRGADAGLGRRVAQLAARARARLVAAYGACLEVLRGDALAQVREIRARSGGCAAGSSS